MVILAVLTTVVFAMSSQQAFGKDDPNAKSPKAAKERAKGQGEVRDGIKERAEELGKELGLTEQQKKDAMPILENETKDLLSVMTSKSLTKEQMLEKINTIHQITKGQLSKMLTPEQQKKYAEMNTDTHDDSQKFAERHIDRMSEKLNLAGQQKKDIAPIIESEMKEVRAITNNESLTREQKWEKINAIHQATKERLSKILTPEQQRKYADEMEHQAPERNAEHSGEGHNNSQQKPVDSNSK